MSNDLLPSNATKQERALASSVARVSDVALVIRQSWNPDTCPEHIIPWLAWAYSVDKWDTNWTVEQKRGAIRNSVFIHRHKGTPAAMKAALAGLGYDITLQEWHQLTPLGDPYTFGISIEIHDIGLPDAAAFDNIVAVANSAKNVRSWMTFINMESTRDAHVYMGALAYSGETVSLSAEA